MSEIAKSFVPIIPAIFRLENDFVQPWVQGYRPQMFQTYWKYIDIDLARQRQAEESESRVARTRALHGLFPNVAGSTALTIRRFPGRSPTESVWARTMSAERYAERSAAA
jgi:hypothetical protein